MLVWGTIDFIGKIMVSDCFVLFRFVFYAVGQSLRPSSRIKRPDSAEEGNWYWDF